MKSTRVETRGHPITIETPFSWSFRTLFYIIILKNCKVNFISTSDDPKRQINCLWETDFGNSTVVLDLPSSTEDRLFYELFQKFVEIMYGHYGLLCKRITFDFLNSSINLP